MTLDQHRPKRLETVFLKTFNSESFPNLHTYPQVSVLKQALSEGQGVDVRDENGLSSLMWAARTGRLSTAKYLVSQGASLTMRDDTTGFSALHFAAYYCR